jgi:iron complex transport system substrate-binding protein
MSGLAAITGCSGDATQSAGADPSASSSPAARSIVTLDPFSTYNLLDLGVVPVGVQDGLETVINAKYAETYADIPKVGTYFEPNYEAIAEIAPELILASTGQVDLSANLEKIGRTVLVTGETSSTWRQAASETAEAIGRSAQLAELESGYETRAEKIKTAHADQLDGTTWAMVWQGTAEGFSIRSAASNGGQVLALAGVSFNATTQQADGDSDTQLSWEQIDQLADADVICLPGTTTGEPNEMTELIRSQRAFKALPAAQAERVFVFDHMTPGSYLNATQLLDELDAALTTLA